MAKKLGTITLMVEVDTVDLPHGSMETWLREVAYKVGQAVMDNYEEPQRVWVDFEVSRAEEL
jgi:hypothetical protein